jgi:hypothetical protein
LLAAPRLWAVPRHETDADLLALIDSASARTLVNIARSWPKVTVLMNSNASVQLEGIAYASPRQLYDTLDFARKGLDVVRRAIVGLLNLARRREHHW